MHKKRKEEGKTQDQPVCVVQLNLPPLYPLMDI